jgi:multicomponent Na+:H+ antiporter subunit B
MSILWMVLESPDLAITEAAVGAGVTSLLFFVTLKKIHAMNDKKNEDNKAPMDEKEKDRSADM